MKPLLFCHTYHTREHKYYIVKFFINQGHNNIVKKKEETNKRNNVHGGTLFNVKYIVWK